MIIPLSNIVIFVNLQPRSANKLISKSTFAVEQKSGSAGVPEDQFKNQAKGLALAM